MILDDPNLSLLAYRIMIVNIVIKASTFAQFVWLWTNFSQVYSFYCICCTLSVYSPRNPRFVPPPAMEQSLNIPFHDN